MTGQTLRVGLVGLGRIAERVHLKVLEGLPDVEVVAVAEPAPERQTVARDRLPHASLFADMAQMLDEAAADAVLICAPPALHAPLAIEAFEAGRHVYLEKPLAIDLEGGSRVLDAWRHSGRVGTLGFNYRFHPLLLNLKQRVTAGELGAPIVLRSMFSVVQDEAPEWGRARRTGGGALLDLGSHHFDLFRFLLEDEIVEVSARVWTHRWEDDTAAVTLRLAGGVHVDALFAVGSVDEDRIEVFGETGKLTWDRYRGALDFSPAEFRYGRAAAMGRELASLVGAARRLLDPVGEPSYRGALAAFASAARGEGPTGPTILDGYRSLEIVVAAEESARRASPVPLSTGDNPRPVSEPSLSSPAQPSNGDG